MSGFVFESYTGASDDVGSLSCMFLPFARASDTAPDGVLTGLLGDPSAQLSPGSFIAGALAIASVLSDASQALRGALPAFEFYGFVADDIGTNAAYIFSVLPVKAAFYNMTDTQFAVFDQTLAVDSLFSDSIDALRCKLETPRALLLSFPAPLSFLRIVMPNPVMAIDAPGGAIQSLLASLQLTDAGLTTAVNVLYQQITMLESSNALVQSLQQLMATAGFADFARFVLLAQLSDSVGFTDTASSGLLVAVTLVDALAMSGLVDSTAHAVQIIATLLGLSEQIREGQFASLIDTVGVSASITSRVAALAYALDALRMSAAPTNTMSLLMVLSDSVALDDTLSAAAQVLAMLRDSIAVSAVLDIGGQPYTAWVMNTETKAMSQYTNFEINSIATINGRTLGASSTGVYALDEGDTDAGSPIIAAVRTGLSSLGSPLLKRVERMYIGYASNGTLCLRVVITGPTGNKDEYTYAMVERPAAVSAQTRAKVGGGLKSAKWSFELVNTDGEYFELHDVRVLPMVLTGRLN